MFGSVQSCWSINSWMKLESSEGRMHSGGEKAVRKRPISVSGPKSEEKVLKESLISCWSWCCLGKI